MEYEYTKRLPTRYCEDIDDYDYEECIARYEPSKNELLMALAEIVNNDYFDSERLDLVILFIKDYDLVEELAENYKDELYDFFEPYAWGRK